MARILLVHGSNHGGWCWRDLAPALGALGHAVATVDLPSVSDEPASLAGATLEDDVAAVVDALDGPAVLVGHSAAGFVIAGAAERVPDAVTGLVYLCAYVPRPGATLNDLAREAPGRPLDGALEVDRVHRAYRFREAALLGNFYGDCPAEVVHYARPRLGWQAIGAQSQAVALPEGVPSHYVVCARDAVIPPEQQRAMAAELPGAVVHELDTGHSPFFAAPVRLAALLDEIARAV